jgi:hypothetical protein
MKKHLAAFSLLAYAASGVASADAPPSPKSQFSTAHSATGMTGPPVNGVALSLTTDMPTVASGAPIKLTIEVRNVSSTTQFLAIPDVPCGYRISATDVTTGAKTDASPHMCDIYATGPWTLKAGNSTFITFSLSDYTKLDPGTDTIRVEGIMRYATETSGVQHITMQSNPVTIRVDP